MADPIRALVLDFGSVITKTVFEIPEFVGRAFSLPEDVFPWRGPLDPERDDLWRAMQRGDLSEREYWSRRAEEIGRLAGRELDTQAFMVAIYEAAGEAAFRPEIDELVRVARERGLKLGILTNELELFHGKAWVDSLRILKLVDAIVDASHTLVLKPDRRAYEAIATKLDVPIEHALFVDDQLRNVEGAHRAGMPTVHFQIENVPASMERIDAALGFERSPGRGTHVHS
jgi:putative hydrolase of the HAD superfamily